MSGEFVETVSCPTWDDLVRQLDRLASSSWVFRGQIDCDWSLQTSLERLAPEGQARTLSERHLIDAFQRRANNYLDAHQIPSQHGDWIALMQHYGAPTRLLDFTRSPFVGAYFAFESLPSSGGDGCAVWAIDINWCLEAAGASEIAADAEFRSRVEKRFADLVKNGTPTLNRAAGAEMAFAMKTGSAPLRPVVVPFEPFTLTVRLSAQQGSFMVSLNPEQSFMECLRAQARQLPGGVKKFVIPHAERPRALEQLRHMNITRASLFPGLQGFAESLQHYLISESPQRRRERSS